MGSIRIGGVKISSILEVEGPIFDTRGLMPDMTPELVAREQGWMTPRWYDPAGDRLVLRVQSYVIETPRVTILVDTGVGNNKTGRRRETWNNGDWPYLENMAAAGYAPGDIDMVVFTHIHVDHVGWNTHLVDGEWVPTFAGARHLFAADELADAERKRTADPVRFGAIWEDSIRPVIEAGLVDRVPPDHVLDRSVRLGPAPGHTRHHSAVWIEDGGEHAVVSGDVMHHPVQGRYPQFSSVHCEEPETAGKTRRNVLDRCVEADAVVMPIHFGAFRAERDGGAYVLEFVEK